MSFSPNTALTAALVGIFALASSPASAALVPAGSSFSFTGGAGRSVPPTYGMGQA